METFPFWDPFGWFWQFGWLLVLPFAVLAGVIWEALHWLKMKYLRRRWARAAQA